jgi:hypothetical protein
MYVSLSSSEWTRDPDTGDLVEGEPTPYDKVFLAKVGGGWDQSREQLGVKGGGMGVWGGGSKMGWGEG